MTIVNIHEAKTQLSALIQKVLDGEEVIIAKNNEPVVTLNKYTMRKTRTGWGKLKGKIIESEDCWDPDPEIENSFYASEPEK